MSAGAIKAGDAYIELGTRIGGAFKRGLAGARSRIAGWGMNLQTLVAGVALRGMAKATGEQEMADAQLAASLERVQAGLSATLPDLKAFAAEIQRLTTYGDEASMGAMARLANIAGLVGEPLKEATRAAVGLAAACEIDLNTAAMLVGRAFLGQTDLLKRYGVEVDANATKQEQLAQVLEKGNAAFAIAEARARTATGRFRQFKNAAGDVVQVIGLALATALKPLIEHMTEVAKSVEDWIGRNCELVVLIGKVTGVIVGLVITLKVISGVVGMFIAIFTPGGAFAVVVVAILAVLDALKIVNIGFGEFVNNVRIGGMKISTWMAAIALGVQQVWISAIATIKKLWIDLMATIAGLNVPGQDFIYKLLAKLFGAAPEDIEGQLKQRRARICDQANADIRAVERDAADAIKRIDKQMDDVFKGDMDEADRAAKGLKKAAAMPKMPGMPDLDAMPKKLTVSVGTFSGAAAPWKIGDGVVAAVNRANQQIQRQQAANRKALAGHVAGIRKDIRDVDARARLGKG